MKLKKSLRQLARSLAVMALKSRLIRAYHKHFLWIGKDRRIESRPESYRPKFLHRKMMDIIQPQHRFKAEGNVEAWQVSSRLRLAELLGKRGVPSPSFDEVLIWERTFGDMVVQKIEFSTEIHARVPAYWCYPRAHPHPQTIFVCLQGHSSGMHSSVGLSADEKKNINVRNDLDYARQCVARGFGAFCLEQRGFGERRERGTMLTESYCLEPSLHSLLLGRTLVGERVFDTIRSIDYILQRVPGARVGVVGNSGGGTVAMYTAALDLRVMYSILSCCVCDFEASIFEMRHCADNYVPGILADFDCGDVASLIAPRPLVVVAGSDDAIFPLAGVISACEVISKVYKAVNASPLFKLVEGNGGHRFYAEQAWRALADAVQHADMNLGVRR